MRGIFIAVLLALVAAMSATPADSSSQRINVVAKRFEFAPSEITVEKGKPVTLVLTSEDVTHGLTIKELNIKIDIKKGQPTEVSFTPNESGDFSGKCSHFCGRNHGDMKFVVHVQ